MPQVIEQQGSPIGRLGKGIGKGLADQIPKEIDRYRLTSGLEKFAAESKGKTPFQQAVDFYKIPGATAEMGYTLFPLLQQEAKREAASKLASQAPQAPIKDTSGLTGVTIDGKRYAGKQDVPKQQEMGSLKPRSATEAQLTPIVRKSEDQLYAEASEKSQSNPQIWPTPEDALPLVKQNEATRIANLQEQRSTGDVADALKVRIKDNLEGAWRKDDTLKDIPGTVQSRIFDNIENELADPNNKKSESELFREGRKLGEEIAKANANLTSAGKQRWFTTPRGIREVIPDIRKTYEKAGALEEFQDLAAANLDLSPQMAAQFAYPLNKEQKKFFKNHVKEPKRSDLASLFVEAYDPEDVKKSSITLADDISDFISDDDSVLSFIAEAQRRHLNPQIILKRLKRNAEDGLWKPNPRQERELQKVVPDLPSLGDFYMSFQLDDESMVE